MVGRGEILRHSVFRTFFILVTRASCLWLGHESCIVCANINLGRNLHILRFRRALQASNLNWRSLRNTFRRKIFSVDQIFNVLRVELLCFITHFECLDSVQLSKSLLNESLFGLFVCYLPVYKLIDCLLVELSELFVRLTSA